jgi:putative Mg2+ transporter-C (MgtC) family protein
MIELQTTELVLRLGLAVLVGAFLGAERIIAHKSAGVRTYALISMGAALFVMVSDGAIMRYLALGVTGVQPTYVLAQIVVAIGFLTGGLFLKHDNHISGLTTASGLWITAGIGAAIGFGLYTLALTAAFFTFLIFTVLWIFEQKVRAIGEAVLDKDSDTITK